VDQFEEVKTRLAVFGSERDKNVADANEQAVPTNVRGTVVRLGVSLAFLAFVDRACISQAAPDIMRDLHLTKLQMGYVFSAFGLSYAALELPSGWLCDRIGARKVLTRVVLCWSALTAATGFAWNFASMFIIRLLFGAGESGCFPSLAKIFSVWLPAHERAVAEGWKAAMGRWGGAFAPYLVVSLYAFMGWRQTFAVFGSVGLVWCVIFFRFYRDQPRNHPGINQAEIALIETDSARTSATISISPLRAFVRSRSAWALCLQWFCHNYGLYFYLTWLPVYLQQARGLDIKTSAVLAGMPLLFAGFGTVAGGAVVPKLSRTIGTVRARRAVAYTSYGCAALLLLAFTFIQNPTLAVVVMSLSSFAAEVSTPVTWITAVDLGGRSVGTLTGAMNSLGQVGASVAPAVIGYVLTISRNNWTLTFYLSAIIYALGIVFWVVLDPIKPLDRHPAQPAISS
jgi:MFS transporter, ACS family, glucarate transporter